jgi:hypothetical protein
VLDGFGQLYPFTIPGVGMPAGSGPRWGFNIARDLTVLGDGGYILDGYGGIHPFGGVPAVRSTFYLAGRDLARRIVLNPAGTGGYVLDAYGGFHPFAVGAAAMPPTPNPIAYWPGWDIARGIAITGPSSGYTLDGFGGLHGFGGATGGGSWYWSGQVQAMNADADPGRGWAFYLDGFGVIHSGPADAPWAGPSATWPGWSIARDIELVPR